MFDSFSGPYYNNYHRMIANLKDFVQIKHVIQYARDKNDPALATNMEKVEIFERDKFIDRGK